MDGSSDNDWLVWQWVDSAFPSGGFVHSAGLEAAVQAREVHDRASLESFLAASLEQVGHSALPFVTTAHQGPEQVLELDALCEAFLSNHVANRASRLQGRALLLAAERIFELPLPTWRTSFAGHLAPIFGMVTGYLKFDLKTVQRLFLFWHLRGMIAAAVRLNRVGPLQAQALQVRLAAVGKSVLRRCAQLGVDDVAQTAPLHDLWQGLQDRLPTRLFQS